MRTSPVAVIDPAALADDERTRVDEVAKAASETGTLDLNALPEDVRASALFALQAFARGEKVTTIVEGDKPLTTNEAAKALGVSRTHLTRMFDERRIAGFYVGSHLKIPASEVRRILTARAHGMTQGREASATAAKRRRDRAARAAGLE